MLKIQQLRVSYGGIQALRGIDLEVPDGKIVTLIGANGAGKSTTLRTISGLVKAESGSIQWNGEELLGKPIDKIISAGIAMSPEGRRVFADLTVLENLKLGAVHRLDEAIVDYDQMGLDSIRDGVIQRFEFCVELAWKTLREYLLDQGYTEINSPKSVMKQAFADGILDHEEGWLHLLDARNETSHIYDEATATTVFGDIRTVYDPLLKNLIQKLGTK